MRKLLLALLSSVLMISCSDKIEVSGTLTTESRQVGNFSKISISDGVKVNIGKGEKGTVTVRTFTSVFDYVQTSVSDDVLYVKVNDKSNFDRNPNIEVTLYAEDISYMTVSGGSEISSETAFLSSFRADIFLSGESYFRGVIGTSSFSLMLSGGSSATIKGVANDSKIVPSGGSEVDGKNFESASLDAIMSDGSTLYINIGTKINSAILSGGSRLYYKGPAVEMGAVDKDVNSKVEKVEKF